MITRPTVLVLGAGAAPHWFPCGFKLYEEICRDLGQSASQAQPSELTRVLLECGFKREELSRFQEALSGSMQMSVDTFLESREEFLDIGKAVIAAHLIPQEMHHKLIAPELTWYRYLLLNG
jgi:hypothetical protein